MELRKKEMIPLTCTIVAILMCVIFSHHNGFTVVHTIQAGLDVEPVQSVSRKQLPKPATSLVFVKTHKTGGTTLASILNRFGYNHRLSFLFNRGDKKHGHFRLSKLAKKKPRSFLPPLCVATGDYTHYRNYSMMTAHLRFLPNLENLKRFMKPDCKYVSILREPSAQWESAFSFFGAASSMHISKSGRGNTSVANIATFLSKPEYYWNSARGGNAKFYSRNGQLFEFTEDGAIHRYEDIVNDTIQQLDVHLDLVLITEHFDESLILLKNLMHWTFKDILYVKKNARARTSNITEEQRQQIREWNSADVSLYSHFNRTLWRKIEEGGATFQKDLWTFRRMMWDYATGCGIENKEAARKGQKMLRVAHVTKNNSLFCKRLVSENYEISTLIMERQRLGAQCEVKRNKVL
ncbi:galactosylceramide sulfotransferase-like isoform X1 [Lytechinus pictus]|uniref:galactosylceramide sulfotransferase-like isoform X1 n=2 Tax=Lytechinus pictus TaxID=7653 RepID=UPI0030B9FF01